MAALEYAIVGRIRKPQGIRGEVVIEPLTDEPAAVFAAGRRVFAGTTAGDLADGAPTLAIERARRHGAAAWVVKFAEIPDRTAAERWRDRHLLLPLDELAEPEEGEIYLDDLPGLRVEEEGGAVLGEVGDVYELPQGIVLDVVRDGRTVVCLLFTEEVVRELDVDGGRLVVRVPEGLMD